MGVQHRIFTEQRSGELATDKIAQPRQPDFLGRGRRFYGPIAEFGFVYPEAHIDPVRAQGAMNSVGGPGGAPLGVKFIDPDDLQEHLDARSSVRSAT